MKKLLFIILLCSLSIFIVSCKKDTQKTNNTVTNNTLIVGLDDTFPPMGFRDENNNIVGFDIDLAKEVAKRLNMNITLQPIDWASKELELNTGRITCIWNGLSKDPARAEAMTLTKPYVANRMVIIVNSSSNIKTKDDLKGKKVGLQAGSTAVKALEKDPISSQVKQAAYENNILALTDLSINRIDAVIMDEIVGRYVMSKGGSSYKILDDSLDEEFYVIAFKKGNTELANKVESTLQDMINDGTAGKISKKWFNQDILLK